MRADAAGPDAAGVDAPAMDVRHDTIVDSPGSDLDARPLLDATHDAAPPLDADGGPPLASNWAVAVGASGRDRVEKVVIDSSGDVIITGMFQKSMSFTPTVGPPISLTSAGDLDIFVARLNSKGEYLWAMSAGGSIHDYGKDVTVDSAGSIYVTGVFMGLAYFGAYTHSALGFKDIFVMKLDASGKVLWAVAAGSTGDDHAFAVDVDGGGNVHVGGTAYTPVTFGSLAPTKQYGKRDAVLARLDKAGTFLWATSAGGAEDDELIDLDVDAAGNITAAGGFKAKASFGTLTATATGTSMDIFVARLDKGGAFTWVSAAGGTWYDRANNLARDSAGNSYIVGNFQGTSAFGTLPKLTSKGDSDAFVARLDTAGVFTWARRAGGTLYDTCADVALDASGNLHVTGIFSGIGKADFGTLSLASNGALDIFVARLSPAGIFEKIAGAGGTGPDHGVGVAPTAAGNVVIGGSFTNTATFGGQGFTSKGDYDAFVWRLDYP